ncbi:hypothetical protein B0A54_17657 [Friedmanniomyces endolithicus]|uniref:Uncharacterized protein n=1 Tax=Friedmanniomyces endolithicus TaxID=329885 RepID=A0A4V6WJP2_9PEZI|nr:hypothetical protein B0A54_17657 [Friedmanniomyces endolithicus]
MKCPWLEKRWQQERPEWIDNAKIAFTRPSQRYHHPGGEAAAMPEALRRPTADHDDDDVLSDEEGNTSSHGIAVTIEQQLVQYLAEPRSTVPKQKESPILYWLQQR